MPLSARWPAKLSMQPVVIFAPGQSAPVHSACVRGNAARAWCWRRTQATGPSAFRIAMIRRWRGWCAACRARRSRRSAWLKSTSSTKTLPDCCNSSRAGLDYIALRGEIANRLLADGKLKPEYAARGVTRDVFTEPYSFSIVLQRRGPGHRRHEQRSHRLAPGNRLGDGYPNPGQGRVCGAGAGRQPARAAWRGGSRSDAVVAALVRSRRRRRRCSTVSATASWTATVSA